MKYKIGSKEKPLVLKTPPLTSGYTMHVDEKDGKEVLVCTKPCQRRHRRSLGRSANNPVGGWYGLKKGLRGRFGMYIPPLMEALGLAEVTHDARGNKMKAK